MRNGKKSLHVPYRDSKLTHLLKGCLNGGDSLTHLIVCLSPVVSSMQECISSMKFAQNAKSIKQTLDESKSQNSLYRHQLKQKQVAEA